MSIACMTVEASGKTLELRGCEATCDGRRIRLSRTEHALLDLLARRQGCVVATDTMRDAAKLTRRASIPVTICRLRRKLAWLGVRDLVHTVWDEGYVIRRSFAAPSIRFGKATQGDLTPRRE